MIRILFILGLLNVICSQAKTQSKADALVNRLTVFGKSIPQEKVFIHMDNTSYFLGDTIWFAAYTRQTNTNTPSKVSGVLYAELYNNDGYLVERKLIEMKEGRGNGFFALAKDIMYSGFYELRAYTRWQLNWGLFEHKHGRAASNWFLNKALEKDYYKDYDKLYSRVFPVYDKPTDKENPERNMTARIMRRYFKKDMDEEERELTLALFPEGGNLVASVPNRVAFEAKWNDGEELEGTLTVGNETIPAVNRGRGVFTITPERGMEREVTFTTKDGQKVSAKLPKPEEQGVALNVKQDGDEWVISTQIAGSLSPDSLAMTIMHEGKVDEFATLSSKFKVQGSKLPVGIHQVTVFDMQGRVYADRLFFVTKPELAQPTLTVSGLKDEYKPYEKIELQVATTVPLPQWKGLGVGLSLSVRDGYQQDQLFDNGNIMTEMLLASEVKGFIPNPGWYFEKDDEEHRQALDLLMMTQGWRRFVWKDMAVKGEWDLIQPDEKTPIIQGSIFQLTEDFIDKESDKRPAPVDNIFVLKENPISKKHGIKIHAELIHPFYNKAKWNEMAVKDGTFQIILPHYYGDAVFFLAASDTTKWKKKGKPEWVQLISDKAEEDLINSRTNKDIESNPLPDDYWDRIMYFPYYVRYYIEPPEFFIRLAFPYPRFVKPYCFYQNCLNESDGNYQEYHSDERADDTHQMREVRINARKNGQKRFDASQPVLIIDADEAENIALDAGIRPYVENHPHCNSIIIRTLMGDYGQDYPYIYVNRITNPNGREDNIYYTYGPSKMQRNRMNLNIPEDSVYSRKYLKPYGRGYEFSPDDQADLTPSHIENLVIYSDYCPRMEGSKRYSGDNLPETRVVQYPYADGSRRVQYRDRRYVLPGFAYPAEFYSPDYSKQTPPEPTDYRRTLYWNPGLKLDEKGQAHVTLYNNSRTTHPNVEAAGQTAEGGLLWNR